MNNLNQDLVAESSLTEPSSNLSRYRKRARNLNSLRALTLLMLTVPVACQEEARLILNDDDPSQLQSFNAINKDSTLTVNSLEHSEAPFEPGDCFHFELSSDMQQIRDAIPELYTPWNPTYTCEFEPSSLCEVISDYTLEVRIRDADDPYSSHLNGRRRLQTEEADDPTADEGTADDAETEEEPEEEAITYDKISGKAGFRNPFITNYNGTSGFNLEITYFPLCDTSSPEKISSESVGLDFSFPGHKKMNAPEMTTSSQTVAEENTATIKFYSPNALSPTGGVITLSTDSSMLEFDPFMSAECKSGEFEFEGAEGTLVNLDIVNNYRDGLDYNIQYGSIPSGYPFGKYEYSNQMAPVYVTLYCDNFINPISSGEQVLNAFKIELKGIDLQTTFALDTLNFVAGTFDPKMFYYLVTNETTKITDLVLKFNLDFETFFDSCILSLKLPIDVQDPYSVEFYSTSRHFGDGFQEAKINLTPDQDEYPTEFFLDACQNGTVPAGPIDLRVTNVTLPDDVDIIFNTTNVSLFKSLDYTARVPQKVIVSQTDSIFLVSERIALGQIHRLRMNQQSTKFVKVSQDETVTKLTLDDSSTDQEDFQFIVLPALNGNNDSISFESVSMPGFYLRQADALCILEEDELDSDLFKIAASFKVMPTGDSNLFKFQSNLKGDLIASPNNINVNMIEYAEPENATNPSVLWGLVPLSEEGGQLVTSRESHGTILQTSDDFENVTGEVSKESQVQIKLKTKSLLQSGSIYSVFLPKWNPFMPEINQTSYIEYSDNINCKGIKNLDDNVTCSFEPYNQEHDRLSIKDGISEDQNGGYSAFLPQTPPPNAIRTVSKLNVTLQDFQEAVGSSDYSIQAFIDAQINDTLYDGKDYSYFDCIEVKSLYEIDEQTILVYDLKANLTVSLQELAKINQNILQNGPYSEYSRDAAQIDPFGTILTAVAQGEVKKLPEDPKFGPVKPEDSEIIVQIPKMLNPLTMQQQTFKVMVEIPGASLPGAEFERPYHYTCACLGIIEDFNDGTLNANGMGTYCSTWNNDGHYWCYVNPQCNGSTPTHEAEWSSQISWKTCSDDELQQPQNTDEQEEDTPQGEVNYQVSCPDGCLGIVEGLNDDGYGSYCSDSWDANEPAWCYVEPECEDSTPTTYGGWEDKVSWKYCDEQLADTIGNPCGCEVYGETFCNYDDGSTGFCEPCSNYETSEDCFNDGLPELGAEDCVRRCFNDADPDKQEETPEEENQICACLGIVETFNDDGFGSYCSDDWDSDPYWCYVDPECEGSIPTSTSGWGDKIHWVTCDQDNDIMNKQADADADGRRRRMQEEAPPAADEATEDQEDEADQNLDIPVQGADCYYDDAQCQSELTNLWCVTYEDSQYGESKTCQDCSKDDKTIIDSFGEETTYECPPESQQEEVEEEPKLYSANELTEETCEESGQNFYDGDEKTCFQCPDYFVADRTIKDCIQNTCDEESEWLAYNGECIKCYGQYELNANKSGCICKEVTSIDEPRCGYEILEQGAVTFQATSPTTIGNVSVFAFNTTNGQRTDMQLYFESQVLLSPGVKIKIDFASGLKLDEINQIIVNQQGLFQPEEGQIGFELSQNSLTVFSLGNKTFILPQVATNLTFSEVKNPYRAGEHPMSLSIMDAYDNLIAYNDQFSYSVITWPLGQQLTGTKRQIISAGLHSLFFFAKQNDNILKNQEF